MELFALQVVLEHRLVTVEDAVQVAVLTVLLLVPDNVPADAVLGV